LSLLWYVGRNSTEEVKAATDEIVEMLKK
jgi:hypothetical protein